MFRTRRYIRIGEELARHAVPFSRSLPGASMRILVVGDSTGVGTGASSPETSLAGLVGARYPEAEVVNRAVNGAKTHEVPAQLNSAEGHFNLVLVHIGGNDVVRRTRYAEVAANIRQVLDIAQTKGTHVLLTSTGNVGTALLLPAITRPMFERRSRRIRKIFLQAVESSAGDVRYTDLFTERRDDPFAQHPRVYYASDFFHPSDAGYRHWFSFMEKELDNFTDLEPGR